MRSMDRETITVKDFIMSDMSIRQKIKNLTYENTQLEQWDNTLLLIGADKYISRRRVREAIDYLYSDLVKVGVIRASPIVKKMFKQFDKGLKL